MAVRDNQATVRRYVEEIVNGKRLDVADDIFAPGITYRDPAIPGGGVNGIEATKGVLSTFLSVFPDVHLTVDSSIAEGDEVGWIGTLAGTHTGEAAGMPPPSGKRISVPLAEFYRIANGKIEEARIFYDMLSLMQQLGAIPIPG